MPGDTALKARAQSVSVSFVATKYNKIAENDWTGRFRTPLPKKRYDAYSRSEFVRIAALLLKNIEAEVSGASHTFAPWKCRQRGQYTSSHVSERRQKLMGSATADVRYALTMISVGFREFSPPLRYIA
jgi:hypothetical protein